MSVRDQLEEATHDQLEAGSRLVKRLLNLADQARNASDGTVSDGTYLAVLRDGRLRIEREARLIVSADSNGEYMGPDLEGIEFLAVFNLLLNMRLRHMATATERGE